MTADRDISGKRYAVIRVPSSGPPALAGPPNDFTTQAEALARIAEIKRSSRITHHTYLDILPYQGPLSRALADKGILK